MSKLAKDECVNHSVILRICEALNCDIGDIMEIIKEDKMPFNEDTRVKIPATIQFIRVGYNYQSLKTADIDGDTKIFRNLIKPALEKINKKSFSDDEISEVISDIHEMIKNNDLGKEFYTWLINPTDKVKLIDFKDIYNNDFFVVDELVFGETAEGSFRPDINILINGIPLAFLEVKKPNNEGGIQAEFKRMINDRFEKLEHKKYFNMLQIIAFSNNMEYETDDTDDDPKAGSFYTTPNGFKTSFSFLREEEKDFATLREVSEDEVRFVLTDNKYRAAEYDTAEFKINLSSETPCNRFVTSLFSPERILYLLRYGIAYVDEKVPEKHIMRYPQMFATRQIIKTLHAGSKGGIIWHTQGSGKTALAAFSNRVIRDYYASKGINTRFFFVVDRLDLLTQANNEFTMRGINAINVSNRDGFASELNKVLSTNTDMKSLGDFTVVNIHKFGEDMPMAKNDYNAKVQRVIFIDEAHRSYSKTGEFFKNLMLIDKDAIFIALTGTPLLSKKERSNLKFGEYIHKYFYDKSIADGYTLRIKKESIDTVAKADIKRNLDLENPKPDKDLIYQSDGYIVSLCHFIEKDFMDFRYANNDKSIGGMIVCNSNPQAKKVHNWFKLNSTNLTTGLVITDDDIPNQANKDMQLSFKKTSVPDMLVVHQMLTTGYDVKRLKKMYLLRNAKQHTLLQTISRVNRPYKNDDGKTYKYGYIVDFVDIEEEYDRTIKDYIEELEQELREDDEETSLSGLVVDKDTIHEKYLKYSGELKVIISTENLEEFSRALLDLKREKLYTLRLLLNKIRECHTEFLLSRAAEYAAQIDIAHNKWLLKEVQNRINFLNLQGRAVDTLSLLSNSEVVDIVYQFIKTRITIMDLSKFAGTEEVDEIIEKVNKIQKGIKENKHKEDIRIVKLNELLQQIFGMLEITDISDLSKIDGELLKALEEIERINKENDRLSAVYDGNYGFVKTYIDYCTEYPIYEKKDIESVLVCIYKNLKEIIEKNKIIMQGRNNFITNVQQKVTVELLKMQLYKKLNLKDWLSTLIGDIYINLQIYR